MGVDVTHLQRSTQLLSEMEGQLGRAIERCFEEEGINAVTGNRFDQVRSTGDRVVVKTNVDREHLTFKAEELFVATGVRPNTNGIELNRIDIDVDERGAIIVDEHYRTANPDVYAAGDVIGEPMLETVAAKEGNYAVRNAFANESRTVDYPSVPALVFTSPEVAAVGITEREYMEEHETCTCRTVDMADLPKARAVENTSGLLQVVKHHETDEIVGVHMAAPKTADMIPEATLAVKFGLTVDDIIDTVHPSPTFSEAFKRTCQAFSRDTSTISCYVE